MTFRVLRSKRSFEGPAIAHERDGSGDRSAERHARLLVQGNLARDLEHDGVSAPHLLIE